MRTRPCSSVSDGNLGFPENASCGNNLGRITTSGTITEFALPRPLGNGSFPQAITAGPDGNLWFTEFPQTGNTIGRISP